MVEDVFNNNRKNCTWVKKLCTEITDLQNPNGLFSSEGELDILSI